jgi:hypothetical protein
LPSSRARAGVAVRLVAHLARPSSGLAFTVAEKLGAVNVSGRDIGASTGAGRIHVPHKSGPWSRRKRVHGSAILTLLRMKGFRESSCVVAGESGSGTEGCDAPGRRSGDWFARAARGAGTVGTNPFDSAAAGAACPHDRAYGRRSGCPQERTRTRRLAQDSVLAKAMAQADSKCSVCDGLPMRRVTPKHASWLNEIEIWFSILVRKLLRRGLAEASPERAFEQRGVHGLGRLP